MLLKLGRETKPLVNYINNYLAYLFTNNLHGVLIFIFHVYFQLPYERIVVLARADKSGTTELFTTALAEFSDQWKMTYGSFSTGKDGMKWNPEAITYFGKQNHGVAGVIGSFAYSIGYVSVADAKTYNLPYAKIINLKGNLVDADVAAIQVCIAIIS